MFSYIRKNNFEKNSLFDFYYMWKMDKSRIFLRFEILQNCWPSSISIFKALFNRMRNEHTFTLYDQKVTDFGCTAKWDCIGIKELGAYYKNQCYLGRDGSIWIMPTGKTNNHVLNFHSIELVRPIEHIFLFP